METDSELVRKVLGGGHEAYADLVRRHERAVLAAAAEVLCDVHLAQDAAQEAFLVAFRELATLRKGDAFGSWTIRIARSTAMRMARRRQPQRLVEDVPAATEQSGADSEHRLAVVLRAVMRLGDKQRQAILLRYFGGHGIDQIAQMTDQNPSTVQSHIFRAIGRLRNTLEDVEL